MVACYHHGNVDYVEELLKAPGVRVDLQNSEGQHTLLCTCEQGHTDIVQLILNSCQHPRVLVNLPDKKRRTSLIVASYMRHKKLLKTSLSAAASLCRLNDTEIVSKLLLNGARITKDGRR